MLTVFGNFEEASSGGPCVTASASAGFFGGNVTYYPCGTSRSVTKLIKANTNIFLGCINAEDVTSDPGVTVSILQPCISAKAGSGDGSGSDPEDPDNVFTVERVSDGFSTYAQFNSNHAINDSVELDTEIGCFDIMGTANVVTPSNWPTITYICGVSPPPKGDGPEITPE